MIFFTVILSLALFTVKGLRVDFLRCANARTKLVVARLAVATPNANAGTRTSPDYRAKKYKITAKNQSVDIVNQLPENEEVS